MGNGLTARDNGIRPILRKYYRPMFGLIRMINLNGVALLLLELQKRRVQAQESYFILEWRNISFPFSLTTFLEILAFAEILRISYVYFLLFFSIEGKDWQDTLQNGGSKHYALFMKQEFLLQQYSSNRKEIFYWYIKFWSSIGKVNL